MKRIGLVMSFTAALLFAWVSYSAAQTGTVVYSEDFEGAIPDWVLDPPWGLTTGDSASGVQSLTDSPGVDYGNNYSGSATIQLDFTAVDRPLLLFSHRYDLEDYGDFGYVEVSTNGTTWRALFFVTGSSATGWYDEEVDLAEYGNEPAVWLRFRLVTNGSIVADGWYIDDVTILDNTTALTYPFSDDMEAAASEDNWIPSTWGRIDSLTDCYSGTRCWTDTPDGNRINGVESSLVLAGPIDLTSAANPQLSFWQRIPDDFGCCGPFAWVEVSTDGGQSWSVLRQYSNAQTPVASWTREQIDLSTYAGLPEVWVRFRVRDQGGRDGWYIDDVLIDDACNPWEVALGLPSNVTEHGMDLSWSCSICADFMQYEIYRSTSPDVSRSSTLVATIGSPTQCSLSDTGLRWPDTTYYYKVYVTDTQGLYNQGSNRAQGTTPDGITPLPLGGSDDMEGGDKWGNVLPWQLIEDPTGTLCHSGTHCWDDSPGGPYDLGEDTTLTTKLLLGAGWPVFEFWHRYNLEDHQTFGYVEVSTDKSHWTRLFYATGYTGADWRQERIDLSAYASQTIWLRFRLITAGTMAFDGWYIDDVSVIDNTAATLPYPFFDDMESAASDGNWISSTWQRASGGSRSGMRLWSNHAEGSMPGGISSSLVLAGTIDLTSAVNPRLSFWHRIWAPRCWLGWYYGADRGYVEVSLDRGHTWEVVRDYYNYATPGTSWVRVEIDVSGYTGISQVLVRFRMLSQCGRGGWWEIDDVLIDDACANPILDPPSNITEHSMDLNWTCASCADFQQYELYRSTTPGVSRSSTLVTTITDPAQCSYSNTHLAQPDTTYYYMACTIDTQDLVACSNPADGKTLEPITPIPLGGSDDMESGDKWGNVLPWGLINDPGGTTCHGGTHCWHDSPAGAYGNNENITLRTRLDLTAGGRPLFKFWERYNLEDYHDFGFVEVSTDGAHWQAPLFFATGFTGATWREEKIDLSEYAYQTIWLRFRLWTDGAGVYDGWYIDDVSVIDNTATVTYPFFDDAESAASEDNWIPSTWGRIASSTDCFSGHGCWTDSPSGNSWGGVQSSLVLAGTIDLSAAENPQLSFWHRIPNGVPHAWVEVSDDGGESWEILRTYTSVPTWDLVQIDLLRPRQSQVLVRFRLDGASGANGWYIDDVRISEAAVSPWTVNPANNHCYRLVEFMSWLDAETTAESVGGHLVTINDADENTWLVDTFGGSEGLHIGATDMVEEGNWVWIDGAPWTYSNWYPGEPDNWTNEDYGQFNYGGPGTWNDFQGGRQRGIVETNFDCVSTPTPTATVTVTPTPTPTPSGTPVAVDLGRGVGRPGGPVCVAATLSTNGNEVAGTSNEIDFDPALFSFSDCLINPAIGPGTAADKQCVHNPVGAGVERVGILGTGNINTISDGLLYTAKLMIDTATADGTYELSNIAGASDPAGSDLAATGTPGEVAVTMCAGDCNADGTVTIGEVIRAVNLFLGAALCNAADPAFSCPVADANNDGVVSIGEIIQCVNRFLSSCA